MSKAVSQHTRDRNPATNHPLNLRARLRQHLNRTLKLASCSLLALLFVAGCKVSDDAIAAAQQMTDTASALSTYYAALAASVTDTIALYELDGAISGIPFAAADRQLPEQTRAELNKRKDLADHLATLAASLTTLTASTAPADVGTAATRLGNDLISVKALPGGSPVPEGLGKAGTVLLELIKEHKEKQAARAMDKTLTELTALFDGEKPTYDSIARTHIKQAGQVTKDLLTKGAVDPTPMLSPALKPFGLVPVPPATDLQATLLALSQQRLDSSVERAAKREEDASAAMSLCLHEMNGRIHLLAEEKRMPLRGNPFSLQLVQSWAASVI